MHIKFCGSWDTQVTPGARMTDKMGGIAVEKKVDPADLNATIAYAMGLPLDHIEMNQSGRPFQVGNKHGKALTTLF